MFGLFKNKATKDRLALEPVTLRPRDCHSHVIPGVDDGSRSLSESLDMLRILGDAGATRVIATSHIFPGRFPNEPEHLRPGFGELQTAASVAGIGLDLELGAEHYLDDTLLARIKQGQVLAFGPERYVLFETFTGEHPPVGLFEVVHELSHRGYTPLVAHIERYLWLQSEDGQEILEDLRAAGARFQVNRTVGKVNAPGVGRRGKFIARLLRRGWIDEVGSDLHRPTPEGRPYAMDAA